MDQDLWSKALNFHGSLLMQTILNEVPEPKSDAEKDKQIMCKFIEKRLDKLFPLTDKLPSSLPEHSVPIVPIEIYRDASTEERRDLFFKTLDRGHILILRVINDSFTDNYKLLVVCKQENHMRLDDLSIIMFLPKLPAELELAGGTLQSNDLIRAAVCSCSIDERKLYVTLDNYILEDDKKNVSLGKIAEGDLPFYMSNEDDLGVSYFEYLHNQTSYFEKCDWGEEFHSILNIKRNYLYSFTEGNLDGRAFEPVVYGPELRKKQILVVSNEHYEKALEFYESGNFSDAFLYFNKALSVHPRNVEALVSRGTLYAKSNNLRNAFADMNTALNIDKNHERASQEMSMLLVAIARTHIEHKHFKKARDSLDAALFVNGKNKEAIAAVEEIRIAEKALKSAKSSGHGKKDRASSCSSDRSDNSNSRKSDSKRSSSKEKPDDFNQGFNLEIATKKFLTSMHKRRQDHEKDHTHRKSQSKSPKSTLSP